MVQGVRASPASAPAASTVISGEFCVVDSHSSMHSCRPAALLALALFYSCVTQTFYCIVEIPTLGTITNIRNAVYNTTNCFGRGSFDDSGVLRGILGPMLAEPEPFTCICRSAAARVLHLLWSHGLLYIGQRRNRMQHQCPRYSSEQEPSASRCSRSRGLCVPLWLGEWRYGR